MSLVPCPESESMSCNVCLVVSPLLNLISAMLPLPLLPPRPRSLLSRLSNQTHWKGRVETMEMLAANAQVMRSNRLGRYTEEDEAVLDALQKASSDWSEHVRAAAARGMSRVADDGDAKVAGLLLEMFADFVPAVSGAAASSLAALFRQGTARRPPPPEVTSSLRDFLKEGGEKRSLAAEVLRVIIGWKKYADEAFSLLSSGSVDDRWTTGPDTTIP